jgi:hypothetical protein
VLERLEAEAVAAADLGGTVPRLRFLSQNLHWIGRNLGAAAGASG